MVIRLDPSASVEKKISHLIDTSRVARRAINKAESSEFCSVAGRDIPGNTTHSLPPLVQGEKIWLEIPWDSYPKPISNSRPFTLCISRDR